MRSRFKPMKKHSLVCLSLLLSSGCACLPGGDSVVSLHHQSGDSAPAGPITLTGSPSRNYLFFNANAGATPEPAALNAHSEVQTTGDSEPTRVTRTSDSPLLNRRQSSAGHLPSVVFFSPSSSKVNAHRVSDTAPKPHSYPPPQQTLQLAARESIAEPQQLQTTPRQPAGRVLMREQMEPLSGPRTRSRMMATTVNSQPGLQPAAPASLARTQSVPLLSVALPSVKRLQPLLTVSQAAHRRESTQPTLTESPAELTGGRAAALRPAVAALTPVVTAVLVETPVRASLDTDTTSERWNSAPDTAMERGTQRDATIVQVSATQSQVFHPHSQPAQPPLRPIPMMLPPAQPGPATNPCDCDPCKETTVHTDQIAALFKRVNDMEAALKRSHQSMSTMEKNLNAANSDIVRLKRDVQYWQQEFGRLEASVQKQHESDIAALNRVSEMLGLLIEDATDSNDAQIVTPDQNQSGAANASAAAATKGELR